GRVEVVSKNPLVIVDFAHTPDGMKKVLNSLKHSELIVLFGAGGDRDKTKRPLMGSVASRYAKRVILTSDNPRSEDPEKIIEDILQGVTKSLDKVIKDRKEAIIYALNSLQEGEVLLILGKGDEEYQEIKGEKYPFSDRKIVKEWLKEIKDKKYGKIDTK
ncbi:MAG: UDP-N-acetylmuramoyl-L-alanyl-D-glutamate--2,6-diaminopimelate ligase, partial [Sulfurospirillaceae bacterium]|nr:UDP-N-acetylmuramoyl-L-alanyl-D-glutamate--2,6-diaminopimelate ligase [Sulfurospirillaceae bacterium]